MPETLENARCVDCHFPLISGEWVAEEWVAGVYLPPQHKLCCNDWEWRNLLRGKNNLVYRWAGVIESDRAENGET